MTSHYLKFFTALLFLMVLTCCKQNAQQRERPKHFAHANINITINGVLNIQNCANWYIDFSRIKRTAIYKDKIICVGFNGGFACLNISDLTLDTVYSKKLNTDFFTNASVFQDTLFAEKFQKLYFWNSEKWVEYSHPFPIKYFDLLFEDSSYVFYSSCAGEFGSILFAYNKHTGQTRAEFTTCPNTVIRTNLGYYVGVHLYHMAGWSSSYIIKDIEKLKVFADSMRDQESLFDRDPRFALLQDTSALARGNYLAFKAFYPKEFMMIASFSDGGKMYHIIDKREFRKNEERRFIGTVIDDSLQIIDSLENCIPKTTLQFGNAAILNEEFYGQGFTMVRNDTIFKISFRTLHQNYQGLALKGYNISTDHSKKSTSIKECIYNSNEKNNWLPKPGQPEMEIEFTYRHKYKIVGAYGNGQDGNYIFAHNEKTKLKFHDEWNFISTIFTYDNRLFIFFKNLGNIGFKYGLVEITDVDKFLHTYKED